MTNRIRWRQRDGTLVGRIRHGGMQQALHETVALLVLITLALTVGIASQPQSFPIFLLSLPLVVSSLVLGPRQLPWYVVFVMGTTTVLVLVQGLDSTFDLVGVCTMFALGAIIMLASFRRSSLGVDGLTGESMLVDLRDRILKQGLIPALPDGWSAVSALQSAGGTPFAGDFLVASRDVVSGRFDLALVDVSGKGEDAGTRALLLSGAFGGLLAALPPEEFLPAANDFLLRQDWAEGFATAIHLSVDLATDHYQLRAAGHPPAALVEAGDHAWSLVEPEGPVLGLIPDADFTLREGQLHPGECLMMFTDGMVESRDVDLDTGITRLLTQARETLCGHVGREAMEHLMNALGSPHDDRALVLVQRH